MAIYRPLYYQFWNDSVIKKLKPYSRLLFLFLISNYKCSQSGIYQIDVEEMAKPVGIETGDAKDLLDNSGRETINSCLEQLKAEGLVFYDRVKHLIFIRNYFRYSKMNPGTPSSLLQAIAKEFEMNPGHSFWSDFMKIYNQEIKDILSRINTKAKKDTLVEKFNRISNLLGRGNIL